MPTMTKDQYDAGLDAICDRLERIEAPTAADVAACNESLARFKATARIVPAQRSSPARPATETTRTAQAPTRLQQSQKRARKAAKESARAARIRADVIESLNATLAARRDPRQAPARPLHEASTDELYAETATAYRAAGCKAPYWQQKAKIAAPVTESAPVLDLGAVPAADLTESLSQMTSEDFARVGGALFIGHARQGHKTPFWLAT